MTLVDRPAADTTINGSSKPVTDATVITVEMVGWSTEPEQVNLKSALPSATSATAYDPEAIKQIYGPQVFRVWRRGIQIFLPLIVFWGMRWWDKKTGQIQDNERRRAVQLRETLTILGPAYIKIGQALSTRPDLVPPVYLEEFTKLQDQLPPFANEVAYQFIEEELGAPPQELYAELSEVPIAAASLGQVYKGKLKTGETVAVKVQRPGLDESIALDVYILRGLASWVQKTVKGIRSDLPAIMDEFAGRLFEEMDYTREGQNAERFGELYGGLPDIYVPKIYWDYTARRVLTMEWITGTKLNQPQQIQAQGIDARYLIDVGIQCSLRQLLEHGFFHADPHPGNLLAMPNGKLAYLDFVMMSEIRPDQRYGLINALVHIVNREFDGLAQDYVNLGFLSPETDLRPIVPALATVFNNAMGASVAELNIQRIFDQLSKIMYDYPFRVPAYYALIVRSLLTMEGIAMSVDSDFKVLSAAYPYVAKRLLTDPAPELRISLKELLFKDGSFRWNRLENLLRNARDNRDYDLNFALNQAVDFLFSERGEFIRDQISREVVNAVDAFGRGAVHQLTDSLQNLTGQGSRLDKTTALSKSGGVEPPALEHLKRIMGILQDTPGFDPMQLVPVLSKVAFRPETQQMGQKIATNLAQKFLARMIREIVGKEPTPQPYVYPSAPNPAMVQGYPLSLPR
jgi:predicted unusual protein kinase regulating ubiquinone biosynthesis (AarF/ABC1/UbiB family)